MLTVAVIPARLASTRLASKLLKDLGGKSVLQRTYEQTLKAKNIDKVVIATDAEEIFEHAQKFGAEVEMTSAEHQSGTDRIAELTRKNSDWDLIINVQGDEPFINPGDIDKAIEPFLHDPLLEMASLYHVIEDEAEINNPNNVKLVTDLNNFALYFSRSPIPFERDHNSKEQIATSTPSPRNDRLYKKHIGLYAYKKHTLLRLSSLPQTELEKTEKLEQLRALENGIKIKMLEVKSAPIGIDTEDDYKQALDLIQSNS